MRSRFVLLTLALAAACTPVPVALPSASPTRPLPTPTQTSVPTTTASPQPSVPSPTRPATPRPTSRVAGDRLLPYYFEIRQLFPLLPPSVEILPDDPVGTEANATFQGLNSRGEPRFSVREDIVIDRGTAAHEIGHAYLKLLDRAGALESNMMTSYWRFRDFPGTWQQALALSQAQTSYSGQWIRNPYESWAEAFRAAVTLEVKERTLDFGKTIDPTKTREFFTLLRPADR